jgi:hypothetical protein
MNHEEFLKVAIEQANKSLKEGFFLFYQCSSTGVFSISIVKPFEREFLLDHV